MLDKTEAPDGYRAKATKADSCQQCAFDQQKLQQCGRSKGVYCTGNLRKDRENVVFILEKSAGAQTGTGVDD